MPGPNPSPDTPSPGPAGSWRGLRPPAAALAPRDLRGWDLVRADLSEADLSRADLSRALLHGARLRGALLVGAHLHGVQGRDADLEGVQAQGLQAEEARLQGAILLGADLRDSRWVASTLSGADLRGADLRGASLESVDLSGADLAGAQVEGLELRHLISARGARITGLQGASEEVLAALLEAGAWQGMPPLVARTGRAGTLVAERGLRRLRRVVEDLRERLPESRPPAEPVQEAEQAPTPGLTDRLQEVWRQRVQTARREQERERQRRRDARENELRAQEQAAREQLERQAAREEELAREAELQRLAALTAQRRRAAAVAAARLGLPVPEEISAQEAAARAEVEAQRLARLQTVRQQARETAAQAEARRLQAEAERARAEEARQAAAEQARIEEEQRLEERRRQELEAAQERARLAAARAEAMTPEAQAERARQARIARQQRIIEQEAARQARQEEQLARRKAQLAERGTFVERLQDLARTGLRGPEDPTLPPMPEDDPSELPEDPTEPGALDLRGSDHRRARLDGIVWRRADLSDALLDGARLRGADLWGARLSGARLADARMREATLTQAELIGADLTGARLRGASLRKARAAGARFVDADLRGADLRGADLRRADLTGADLRKALLAGADLREADLSAARMTDLELVDVRLDGAQLDQADLAGVRWGAATVEGADLSGALGLTSRERVMLAERGARAGEAGFELLSGRVDVRQLRAAVALLALGGGVYLAARFLGSEDVVATARIDLAEELRALDPGEASVRYEALASDAKAPEDRLSYALEAAVLADQAGDDVRAARLFEEALGMVEDGTRTAADVRLRFAGWRSRTGAWDQVPPLLAPVLAGEGWSTEARARAVVLDRAAAVALGQPRSEAVDALMLELGDLPEAEAELRLAVAELESSQGHSEEALAELDVVARLDLPQDLRLTSLETRARVLERAGELEGAGRTLEELRGAASPDTLAHQRATLALAALHHRLGRERKARALLAELDRVEGDPEVRAQAAMLEARILEDQGDPTAAAQAWRRVLGIEGSTWETRDDARVALAALLSGSGRDGAVDALVAELSAEEGQALRAQVDLGRARALLDAGESEEAEQLYRALVEADPPLPPALLREARTAHGEAQVAMGEIPEAVRTWRELLSEGPERETRVQLELLLAHALLQAGDRSEARLAFTTLAEDSDEDTRTQGLLGLAEVARAEARRELARRLYRQVADQASDVSWKLDALAELADIAAEAEEPEEALSAWREVLALVPPAHPAAHTARLAELMSLADLERVDEAAQRCTVAIAAAPAGRARGQVRLACAEIRERAGALPEALADYRALLDSGPEQVDLLTDAALGAARVALELGRSDEALEVTGRGLELVVDPASRLTLLSTRVRAAEASGDSGLLAQAIADRDALAEEIPELAGPVLVDAAVRARDAGRSEEAISLLRRAVTLPMREVRRAAAWTELGDAWAAEGSFDQAAAAYAQAAELGKDDPQVAFTAGMGLAQVQRSRGDPAAAVVILAKLAPPDEVSTRWWTEALASARTEAGDDDALSTWEDLARAASDPGTKAAAYIGQAELLFSQDRYAEALARYDKAIATAVEPAEVAWARLGRADALVALERRPEARELLDGLRANPDPEVALQARLRSAQLATEEERWLDALALLEGTRAGSMGPGWDSSITETRAVALFESGDPDGARQAWLALAERWPGDEEALAPAWLGLADLSWRQGELGEARTWVRRVQEEVKDPGWRERAQTLETRLDTPAGD